ncbi:MAG: 3-dehydroquinate synthase [Firmicutes bacterium]|jgi:3-dehydroquinate synthase|nr:3-dehydroquinate synthase [Bacillota bacterium]
MKIVEVNTPSANYQITIGRDLFDMVNIDLFGDYPDVVIVSNTTVFPLYGSQWADYFTQCGKRVYTYQLPDGEEYKTFATAEQVLTFLLKHKLSRKTLLVALGGGVVGDLAGFVATIYLRGIPFIQIPTTLLAQVDSSVGGKVAVNHELGKNMIGAFYQPKAVWTDLDTLRTLDLRERRAGLAEVIKYGIIWDGEFLNFLATKRKDLLLEKEIVTDLFAYVVARCCEIKSEVVSQDEDERGIRAVLNFGHTIGHAIERATNYRVYRHGEAVAIGMVAVCRLAYQLKCFSKSEFEYVKRLVNDFGLPTDCKGISVDEIFNGIFHDKKTVGDKVTFVLPKKLGEVEIVSGIDEGEIKQAIEYVAGT